MANKSMRIRTTVGGTDKYVTTRLENDIDFFEILSLKIGQKDIYGSFNSDYGVIIGRVTANDGIGIPNAKISVFIPLSEEDSTNPEITAIYPYTTPRDKNLDGVKYNLLPRVAVNNPFLIVGAYAPTVPVGTFPTKEETTTNPTFLEIYEKYYKYTTVTNQAGDYMIFGAPVGIQTVHMSCDITDIGEFSMTPATMISQLGYAEQLFNGNKIKFTTDLDNIPSVDLQNISVDVKPFWGDTENFEIGITRQDFRIKATLVTSVTVFGAGFTDNFDAVWGLDSYFGDRDDSASAMSRNRSLEAEGFTQNEGIKYNTSLATRRNGNFSIDVYTLRPTFPSSELTLLDPQFTGITSGATLNIYSGDCNTETDLVLLAKTQYSEILDDGMFILTLPCNRNKKIVNEFGELVSTTDDDPNGIFTEFVGSFIIDYGTDLQLYNNPVDKPRTDRDRSDRIRFKFPQVAKPGESFTTERAVPPLPFGNPAVANYTIAQRQEFNEAWRKQVFKFEGGKIYSIARYNGIGFMEDNGSYYIQNGWAQDGGHGNNNAWRQAGSLAGLDSTNPALPYSGTTLDFPFNVLTNYDKFGDPVINNVPAFGAEYLNWCIYFFQMFNYTSGSHDVLPLLTPDYGANSDMTVENNYRVLGFRRDTSYFGRSDVHFTSFMEIPVGDLVKIIQNVPNKKGFTSSDPEFAFPNNLEGNYPTADGTAYFYRGIGNADILAFLIDNGIVSA